MKRMLPILAFFTVSCAKSMPPKRSVETQTTYTSSSELEYYFEKFQKDIGVNTGDVGAEFVSLPSPKVGQCLKFDSGDRIVQIDSDFWATATPDAKEELMYHELGHCVLDLEHVPGIDTFSCPYSTMYPAAFGFSDCYANNKQAYYAELRGHRQ